MLVPPISLAEFVQLLHKCRPFPHWPNAIAVANSGGPDSMCLLYLLSQTIKQNTDTNRLPTTLYSVHINHGLQPANDEMAKKVSALARSLQVVDEQRTIPWGQAPYPEKPLMGRPFEEIARAARSRTILDVLTEKNIMAVAYGHHADDQVETVLMRLMRGSGQVGAAGMRRLRVWGMGSGGPEDLRYAGNKGMRRWILRPFLDVSKDRILATCDAHNIEYVTDPSNFQPEATVRNYIRHSLASRSALQGITDSPAHVVPSELPTVTDNCSSNEGPNETASPLEQAILKLQNIAHTEDLREAVRLSNEAQSRLDRRVAIALESITVPSPMSTIAFSSSALAEIVDPELRIGLVREILQRTSPKAWGSLGAVADGRQSSLERIVDKLWRPRTDDKPQKAFSAGASVAWKPIVIKDDGRLAMGPIPGASRTGWIAYRAPPSSHSPYQIVMNISGRFINHNPEVQLLWDNRFEIWINAAEMKAYIPVEKHDSVIISPRRPWFLPSIQFRSPDQTIELAAFSSDMRALQTAEGGFQANYPGIYVRAVPRASIIET
ncbi:hypothetical protein BDW22DRAFT_1354170 [Trametopsis cervina]|nr:hypothetical protein BDW22DRAFT_1354170 [Trametopsis cervina]